MTQQRNNEFGYLYTVGCGEFGQLGYEAEESHVPTIVPGLRTEKIKQIVCGALQTWALTENGNVYSFGSNDNGELGRNTMDCDPDEIMKVETTPDKVILPHECIKLSGGDSHCAALMKNGQVFAWGSFNFFQDQSYGVDHRKLERCSLRPVLISQNLKPVIDIVSGNNHLVLLCKNGTVFTLGDGRLGQLGRRLPQKYRGDKIGHQLRPRQVILVKSSRIHKAKNIWAGGYSTFIQCTSTMWAFGNNNWHQSGVTGGREIVVYPRWRNVLANQKWKQVVGGDQHTIALNKEGKVFSFGRNQEGQCGIMVDGVAPDCIDALTAIPKLQEEFIEKIATGDRSSFAVTKDGKLFGWGVREFMGIGDKDQDIIFQPLQLSKILEKVTDVDGGGQHTAVVIQTID